MDDPKPYVVGFVLGIIVIAVITTILLFAGSMTTNKATGTLVKNFCINKGYDTGTYKQIADGIEITCTIDRDNTQAEMKYVVRNGEIFAWVF